MRLIHVKTQEQYNDLMKKLEEEGYKWAGIDLATYRNYFPKYREETVIDVIPERKMVDYWNRESYRKYLPDRTIEVYNTTPDLVNHPPHYNQGGIEVIDIIQASMTPEMFRGYLLGNVLKYMLRAPYKGNTEQDHEKAKWYYDKLRSVSDENE